MFIESETKLEEFSAPPGMRCFSLVEMGWCFQLLRDQTNTQAAVDIGRASAAAYPTEASNGRSNTPHKYFCGDMLMRRSI